MYIPLTRAKPFYPGQWGIPGSDNSLGLRTRPQSCVYYVDQNYATANDNNDGTDPEYPLLTITAALTRCVSGRGDVIVVMPGDYQENLVVTKNYIHMVGALQGAYARPDVGGDSDYAIIVHAQGFYAEHIRFYGDSEDGVLQQGNGYTYKDCVFDGDGIFDDFELLPDLDDDSYSASEGMIEDCLFRYGNIGLEFRNPGPGIEGGIGPTDVTVRNCRFSQHTTSDISDLDSFGSNDTTFLNCFVDSCLFVETGAAFVYIDITAGGNNTGMISNCAFADADMVAAQIAMPAGVFSIGNMDGTYAIVP
jgi:hypothetical protein